MRTDKSGAAARRVGLTGNHKTEDFLHLLIKHGGNRVVPEAQRPSSSTVRSMWKKCRAAAKISSRWSAVSSPVRNGCVLRTYWRPRRAENQDAEGTTSAMSPRTDRDQPRACRDCTLIKKRVSDPAIKHAEMVSSGLHRAGVSAVPVRKGCAVIYCRCGPRQQVSCECFDQVAVGTKRVSSPPE